MRRANQVRQVLMLNFRQLMRNRTAFFFNLIMPVLMLLYFGAANGGTHITTVATVAVGLVDQDGGPVARLIETGLRESGHFRVEVGDEAELIRRLDAGKVRAVLVLPPGLSERVAAGTGPSELTLHWDPTSSASVAARGGLQYLVQSLETFGREPLFTVRDRRLDSTERLGFFDFTMPGLLVYMVLNAGIMSVGPTISFQRRAGTLRHMFSTPLTLSSWLLGTVGSIQLMAVLQWFVLWGAGIAMFNVHMPANLPGTLLILLLSSTAGIGIGLAIAAFVRNGEAAMPVSIIVSMGLSFLGGAMLPLDQAPEIVQAIMRVMPSFYMTHALQQVTMKGQSLATALPDLGVLAGTAALSLSLAAWRLRRTVAAAV
ncbi:ABC-2 type transport system permease protein [Symbiobacterium terraclitae]|uniref:ABC-2 type transport system permease protein n=1 Tax=Symbiobacterium terraclitae TaxID=557451 RepID=A0ABS4JPK8_9FIRM|nr:ABC transporter permease [Symbiobacterium terraclitae]MBP2017477.1 ABC-2 type transport system permease protein [Symbiobacterium terraclitae]